MIFIVQVMKFRLLWCWQRHGIQNSSCLPWNVLTRDVVFSIKYSRCILIATQETILNHCKPAWSGHQHAQWTEYHMSMVLSLFFFALIWVFYFLILDPRFSQSKTQKSWPLKHANRVFKDYQLTFEQCCTFIHWLIYLNQRNKRWRISKHKPWHWIGFLDLSCVGMTSWWSDDWR